MSQSDYEAKVRQFHEVMGVTVNRRPNLTDEGTRILRCRLLLEEVLEFCEASNVSVTVDGKPIRRAADLSLEPALGGEANITSMAQELADVQYVTSGTAVTFGLPLAAIFDEVHAANMRKVGPDGTVHRRPDGKVVKPAGWRGPDVARVLAEAGEVTP